VQILPKYRTQRKNSYPSPKKLPNLNKIPPPYKYQQPKYIEMLTKNKVKTHSKKMDLQGG